jgi:hypothetical protein
VPLGLRSVVSEFWSLFLEWQRSYVLPSRLLDFLRQLEPRVSPRKLKQARREPKGGGGSSSSGGVKPGPAHRLKERRNDAEEKQSRALNELKKLGDYCSAGPRYYSLSK